jgi:hypothetical protein
VSHRLRRMVRVISGALLALMLVGPGAVSAATPDLIPTFTVIPTTVNNGDYVAMRASIFNNDTSTVSQLYLVELVRDLDLTFISISTSQGTCNTTGVTTGTPFMCTLGQLKPRKTATVTAIFRAPAIGLSATERWEFNTTGLGSGSGDNSHGDSWPSYVLDSSGNPVDLLTVALSDSADFGGRYVLNENLKIVENSQALSSANPHSTRAYAPVTGIGVTVEDIDCSATTPDPICADFTTGFGQVSKVNVNDDVDDSGITSTTLLHFYLQLDSSEIPAGTNVNNVSVYHVYPGGSETIDDSCTFARRTTTPNNAPCIVVKNLPGGDIGVDVYTFHNGGLRLQ